MKKLLLILLMVASLQGCSVIRQVVVEHQPLTPQQMRPGLATGRTAPAPAPAPKETAPVPKMDNEPKQMTFTVTTESVGMAPKVENSRADEVIRYARTKLGCKYKYAGSGPDLFDCSGFTAYVFSHFGIKLPHSSQAQFDEGSPVEEGQLRKGDLAFWAGRAGASGIGHVGIVVDVKEDGTFTFIHAASTGIQVDRSEAPYYASRYRGARRLLQ